ncbi:MAG: HAD-IA family hydrolase [Leptothrix ochracea]|uniref:HAD-IA family hydrolase n=1 Tax=Leptothrix ochracea TaxID=735331 RepID=UPI0034E22989
MTLRALLWDVDGTLAETERDGHRAAFNMAFKEFSLSWRWDVEAYGQLLHITGGRERMLHDFETRPEAPREPVERERLALALHRRKNELYAQLVRQGGIQARPGVKRLIEQAHQQGLRQAIATTTSRSNVNALLRGMLGEDWQRYFAGVVCGEDVEHKKPDPEVYLRALADVGVEPYEALAMEDSAPGLKAARAAGVPALITRSIYFANSDFSGAWAVMDDLDQGDAQTPGPVSLDALSARYAASTPTAG